MNLLYVIIGIKHFTDTNFFIEIVPPIINWKKEAVLLSGFIEISLGVLLFNQTRKLVAWGIYKSTNFVMLQ